ncbi:(2Fe-2S)-binding protein, partial [Pseudacidovorax intermedius]
LQRDGELAHVRAVLLAGDTRAEGWLKTLIQDRLPAQDFGRRLLSYQATPPVAVVSRGKTVCNCFGVAEQDIAGHLAACDGSEAARLAGLQQALRCGTNCGSCVPELRRMVRETPVRLHRQAA